MSPAGLVLLKLSAAFDSMEYPNVIIWYNLFHAPHFLDKSRGEHRILP